MFLLANLVFLCSVEGYSKKDDGDKVTKTTRDDNGFTKGKEKSHVVGGKNIFRG